MIQKHKGGDAAGGRNELQDSTFTFPRNVQSRKHLNETSVFYPLVWKESRDGSDMSPSSSTSWPPHASSNLPPLLLPSSLQQLGSRLARVGSGLHVSELLHCRFSHSREQRRATGRRAARPVEGDRTLCTSLYVILQREGNLLHYMSHNAPVQHHKSPRLVYFFTLLIFLWSDTFSVLMNNNVNNNQ